MISSIPDALNDNICARGEVNDFIDFLEDELGLPIPELWIKFKQLADNNVGLLDHKQ